MPLYRKVSLYALSIFITGAGILHFLLPQPFMDIVPAYLGHEKLIVYLSGVAEIVLGLGILPRATRVLAAWGLVALLVAVFPANIYMAMNGITPAGLPAVPTWAQWARLPLQFVLIGWAMGFARRPDR